MSHNNLFSANLIITPEHGIGMYNSNRYVWMKIRAPESHGGEELLDISFWDAANEDVSTGAVEQIDRFIEVLQQMRSHILHRLASSTNDDASLEGRD